MAGVVSDRSVLYAFRIEGGKPWYLLLRRAPHVDGPGTWESIVAEPRGDEGSGRAAIRTLVEVTSLDPQALWVLEHVETEYDARLDVIRLMPCFAALVAGEVKLGQMHDTLRWFSPTEATNALRAEPKRAAIDAVHREIGALVASGGEPDPRLRIV
jgi:dihydroneopterin triphosphate diphosphatase